MKLTTDIDIDVGDRKAVLQAIPHIVASMETRGSLEPHNTGIYLQDIPAFSNNLATIEYKKAEELGYFKLDILNNSIYSTLTNEQVKQYAVTEPYWELLEEESIVNELAHIRDHFDIVSLVKPRNIDDLAIVLALIRPGKRHLVGKRNEEVLKEIWAKPQDGSYYFKKAHAYAFALSIVVQLNHMVEQNANT